MTASFDNTVGILVKAYLDGTLLKGDCHACAVGNICATALGLQVSILPKLNPNSSLRADAAWNGSRDEANWGSHFMTTSDGEQFKAEVLRDVFDAGYTEDEFAAGKRQLLATGYKVSELARIEYAFETAGEGYTEEAEFAGLMAVVSVLAEIHGISLEVEQAAKALFVK